MNMFRIPGSLIDAYFELEFFLGKGPLKDQTTQNQVRSDQTRVSFLCTSSANYSHPWGWFKFKFNLLIWLYQCVWTAFCKIFSGTLHLTIFGAPKYAPKCIFGPIWHTTGQKLPKIQNLPDFWPAVCQIWPKMHFGAYLGSPNMVKWSVPEKILQNAVQTPW